METDPLVAWVDESGSNSAVDPGTYIMAAAITTQSQVGGLRDQMRELLLPGQAKLHWRDEQDRRHREIATSLATVEAAHFVVVTSPHKPSSTMERRRRLTLEILLGELWNLSVETVTFESRGPADDRRDREMLNYLRQQGALNPGLRIDHATGRNEPALWARDAVCGIVSALRSGDSRFFEIVRHRVTLMQQAPR